MNITVYAGSSRKAAHHLKSAATELGRLIAKRRHTLIYGGGSTGLMGALADAALGEKGQVIGVILDKFVEANVHHQGLEALDIVDNMRSRKAELERRANAFIALPGGFGTFEEFTEILSFLKLGFHRRPLVLLNIEGFYDPFANLVDRAVSNGLEPPEHRSLVLLASNPGEAVDLCEAGRWKPEREDSR